MKNEQIILYLFLLLMFKVYPKNIVLLTLPKSGTNLVLKLLKQLSGKNELLNVNSLIPLNIESLDKNIHWGHEWIFGLDPRGKLEPTSEKIELLKKLEVKLILLVRDPRQHIITLLKTINKPINDFNLNWAIVNFPEVLYESTGTYAFLQYQDINSIYKNYLRWKKEYPFVYITFFEKLVGPKGSGSYKVQIDEIKKISKFLDIEIDDLEINKIAEDLFGDTPTFREGKISSWKKYYSNISKTCFKNFSGNLLSILGYETSNDW